nr:hypothetical protein CFP56_19362 [Quercus suber]
MKLPSFPGVYDALEIVRCSPEPKPHIHRQHVRWHLLESSVGDELARSDGGLCTRQRTSCLRFDRFATITSTRDSRVHREWRTTNWPLAACVDRRRHATSMQECRKGRDGLYVLGKRLGPSMLKGCERLLYRPPQARAVQVVVRSLLLRVVGIAVPPPARVQEVSRADVHADRHLVDFGLEPAGDGHFPQMRELAGGLLDARQPLLDALVLASLGDVEEDGSAGIEHGQGLVPESAADQCDRGILHPSAWGRHAAFDERRLYSIEEQVENEQTKFCG